MSTARCLGDRHDRRGLDGSAHRSRHEADLSTSCRASFDSCLPGARLDNLGGDPTHARLHRRSDRGFDRSWGRALFHRCRFSPLAGAALPQRNMAQLRAGRSQLSLRSDSAWCGLGTTVRTGGIYRYLFSERRALVGSQGRAHPDPRTEARLRSVADRASGEFREITRAGLMTVRGTTRAGLVVTLVFSQLVVPQAFAENGVVSCSRDQRGKISNH
jgi:hypothetical protein